MYNPSQKNSAVFERKELDNHTADEEFHPTQAALEFELQGDNSHSGEQLPHEQVMEQYAAQASVKMVMQIGDNLTSYRHATLTQQG